MKWTTEIVIVIIVSIKLNDIIKSGWYQKNQLKLDELIIIYHDYKIFTS